jgi:ribosomal protein S18 acetylase RimI-like enzyme
MFFETKEFYVDLLKEKDVNEIVEVYNSNKHFLMSHMDKEKVESQWVIEELCSMKEAGFDSCKVVEKSTGKIIGAMDFKIGEETYLSLLIIHNDFRRNGFGKLVCQAFEEYVRLCDSRYIRIDVVNNYDSSVIDFWIKNGFVKFDDVVLNWTGKRLPAVTMKKCLR